MRSRYGACSPTGGTEYCGDPERHERALCLTIEDIDHTRTKTKRPQRNGVCERFHNTMLQRVLQGGLQAPPADGVAQESRCAIVRHLPKLHVDRGEPPAFSPQQYWTWTRHMTAPGLTL